MNKKITLICGRTFTVIKFRKNLVKALQRNNYDVSIIALDNDYEDEIKKWNTNFYYINQNNRSINPFKKAQLLMQITGLLNIIKPNTVFTFMHTPNIFGVFAAKISGVRDIYSMVEGAGDVFTYNSLKWKAIRIVVCFLYKRSFKYIKKAIFLNIDDEKEFIGRKIINEGKCVIIPGIGIDTKYYAYKPLNNTNTFLMIARMMPTKGILEYCEAARIVKKKYPKVVFNYIGEEFILTKKDIQEFIDDGSINYLGYIEDVRPYYENCFCYIHSSYYREGFPMVMMEANSIGRAIIAFNNIGSKDIIEEGENGIIIRNVSSNELAEGIIYALENKDLFVQMSKSARLLAENKFSEKIINDRIIEIVNE